MRLDSSTLFHISHLVVSAVALGLACSLAFDGENQAAGVVHITVKSLAAREPSLIDPVLSIITQALPTLTLPPAIQSAADKAAGAVTRVIDEAKERIIEELFTSVTLGTRFACAVVGGATECLTLTPIHALLLGGVVFEGVAVLLCAALLRGFKWAMWPLVLCDIVALALSVGALSYSAIAHDLVSSVALRLRLSLERGAALEQSVVWFVFSALAVTICVIFLLRLYFKATLGSS